MVLEEREAEVSAREEQLEAGAWVEVRQHAARWSKGRGRGRRRLQGRTDVRVNCSAWGGHGKPLWHRLLAFYLQNPQGLSKRQFALKDVARAA